MPNKSIGWLVCCIIESEQTMHGMKCMLCAIQYKYAHTQHKRTWKLNNKKTKKKRRKFITKTASVLQISQIVFKHFSSPNGIRVWIFQLKCVWMPWKNGSYRHQCHGNNSKGITTLEFNQHKLHILYIFWRMIMLIKSWISGYFLNRKKKYMPSDKFTITCTHSRWVDSLKEINRRCTEISFWRLNLSFLLNNKINGLVITQMSSIHETVFIYLVFWVRFRFYSMVLSL